MSSKTRQIRISGGELKGRQLRAPGSAQLRPTTERNREAIFSTLFSLGSFSGARVLDLYAGTGALGVEALSRGAASAVFVESNRKTAWHLEENLKELGLFERSRVVCHPVEAFLSEAEPREYALVLADPPYTAHPGVGLLRSILSNDLLASQSTIVLEGKAEMKNADLSSLGLAANEAGFVLEGTKMVSQGDTSLLYCTFTKSES